MIFIRNTLRLLGAFVFMGAASAVAGPLEDLQPGEWVEIPNSALSTVSPCPANNCSYSGSVGQKAIIETWNGGALATKYGAKGGLVVFGGGHNGYLGNEVYIFDIALLKWVRASEPVANPVCNHAEAELQDGSPCAPHTYDYVSYHPGTNSFVKLGSASDHEAGGTGSARVHMFSLDTNKWRRGASRPRPDGKGLAGGAEGASSAYDPNRDVFWALFSFNEGFAKFDPNANSGNGKWTTYGNYFIVIDAVAAIDTVHDLYVAVEGRQTHSLVVFDLKDPSVGGITVQTSGDASAMQTKLVGFDWDPKRQSFIAWIGGTDVYELKPPARNWKKTPWQWSKIAAAPTNKVKPTAPNQYGTYGRWRYVPSIDAFIVVNGTTENVFFYKLPES